MIDKMVMKNCKRRMKNLSVVWIDYTKAYDMVLHTWILQYLKIAGTLRIFSNDVRMQFEISKCQMLEMKRGKVMQSDGTKLPSRETRKSLKNEKECKSLVVLQFDSARSKEMKSLITKEYYLGIRKI